jgi:hypothetical protein
VFILKRLFVPVAVAVLLGAPGAVWAQSSMMMSNAGTGPHAYDWMLGTWTCKNAIPNALAGPAVQTLNATRSVVPGTIVWRYTGTNYDQYGFLTYSAATKTWWSSWAYPGGGTGHESTKQTGPKTMWTGTVFNASGKPFGIRDTYTIYSPAKFNDSGEDNSTGTWKSVYNGTCTKA